jgi:HTH-type transcriptional regulator / antitoxin HipB
MRAIITPGQIGTLLAARRKHLKLSQADLAKRVGISQNRLSVLESNSAALNVKQLLALLNALGLEMTLAVRAP